MRVRLGGANLQSGLNADGRLSDLEATSDARFRYVKEPQTELVFQAGENGVPNTLTTYIDGKCSIIIRSCYQITQPPHRCRSSPEYTAAMK